jgi:hypothetical protein
VHKSAVAKRILAAAGMPSREMKGR